MHFSISALTILGHFKAAIRFISTDETRVHLNSVKIEWADKAVRFVSTDGHRLLASTAAAAATGEHGSLLLARADVLRIVKVLDRKSIDLLTFASKGALLTVTQGSLALGSFKAVDATFPPYAQVIPAPPSGTGKRAATPMDFSYIVDAAAALNEIAAAARVKGDKKPDASIVITHGAGELDPVIFTSAQAEAVAVVMPRREGADQTARLVAAFQRALSSDVAAAAE